MIAAVVMAATIALIPNTAATPQLAVPTTAPVNHGGSGIGTSKFWIKSKTTPYRGHFWIKSQKKYTKCVMHYESRSHWDSTARADGYFGAFKFTKPLTRGATFMMTKELRFIWGDAMGRFIAKDLRATEMHKWLPFYQAMAFATVLNWEGAGSGQSHWAAQRNRCFL